MYPIWTPILTADFSVYLAGLTDFDCGIFRSVHLLWTLNLTTDIIFEMGLTAGVTGQQGMLTPPRHLILPSHLSKVRVALYSIL
jgi:hypothetical protein